MNLLHTIGAAIASVGIFIGSLFGFSYQEAQQPTGDELGRAVNPVAGKTYVLAGSGISSSATSITLTSFTIPVSNRPYTMAHFGDTVGAIGYLTIEPGNPTRQEFVSFTGITQNADGSATLTGVSRGLAPVFPYTASSTYSMAHSGGAQVVISNAPQLYEAIYSYIDNATTSGAVDATPTIKGLMEVATGREAASTTASGLGNTTAPLALTSSIATSTSPTSGNFVVVTNFDGNIDTGFFPDALGSSTVRIYAGTSTSWTTTWTEPANLKYISVEVIGGGGAGGGANGAPAVGVGGGAGAYAKKFITASNLPSTVSLTAGNYGVGVNEVTGGNGGTSVFTGFATSTGGLGGLEVTAIAVGASGGVAVGGDINVNGATSTPIYSTSVSGDGASSIYGSGGAGVITAADGFSARGYGAGGGGARDTASTIDKQGGDGAPGVVIITEYF